MNRLTNRQKMLIKKYTLLTVSILLITGIFLSIPSIARALPRSLAEALTRNPSAVSDETASEPDRLTALMGDSFTAILGFDYEAEPEIPILDITEGAKFVQAVNLCWYTIDEEPQLYLINRTNFSVNLNDFRSNEYPISREIGSEPTVLIVHTHGTESYLAPGIDYYTPNESFRSTDESKTVVAVGKVLAEELNKRGIVTIHDTVMHDKDDYSNAYTNSKRAVAEMLKKYPTIKYVIDLHRDAVFTSDGTNQKPVTAINGQPAAQVMLVVGTNQGGADHPNWRKNLTVAVALQETMNRDYPTLSRPICLRSASFNQQLSPGYLLLEVGSCGNTIEEAKNAAKLFAAAFASTIKQN
ncbi:MAG TPA: stage II sporulation protein P [Bacillota bacterium]|nr:stage II sporulation protein P [Bacillota bacterium]HOK68171.1 stage II sporulation protein P [Bacillota bacterium]HPP84969.1 stage II sporulation protein P [Bacillota bacterium]